MKVTADISMYPLTPDYKPAIKQFICKLRTYAGLELVTNQMSTQIRGDFAAVSLALNECMSEAMQVDGRVVFVTRFLNADLDIQVLPEIE